MNSCNTLKNVLEKTQCDPRLTHANKDYAAHAAREAMRAESWIQTSCASTRKKPAPRSRKPTSEFR